jgi:hypothetical protein
MAMTNGVFGPFLDAVMDNDKVIDLTADTVTWQTTSNTVTPDYNAWDEEVDLTNEVTGTGYTAGGESVVGNSHASASGFATFDHNDISLPNTTLSLVRGMFEYDNTPTGDPLLMGVSFGADYSTSNGTFAVTLDANGLYRIDYIP